MNPVIARSVLSSRLTVAKRRVVSGTLSRRSTFAKHAGKKIKDLLSVLINVARINLSRAEAGLMTAIISASWFVLPFCRGRFASGKDAKRQVTCFESNCENGFCDRSTTSVKTF